MALYYIALLLCAVCALAASSQLTVRASTGYYNGLLNPNFTDVREFRNIPFGQTTAGNNRWLPPKAVPLSSEQFNSTQYPPSCPQYVSAVPSVWNRQIPQYLVYNGNANNSAGESAVFTSEDCLRLAVWTPADAKAGDKLPVALFWTGGGFQTNGVLVPGQLPSRWVHRSQSHIVVTINYRMNIMGFPNAAGLYDQNLGLLDQRLSLEWVRDNIAYFGGDPSRIMIWGQSAGAMSVDYHNYAFWDNPIAHAMFAQSGTVIAGASWRDQTNFTFVAQGLGCDYPYNATAELNCMRQKDYSDIINFMGHYQDTSTLVNPSQPSIAFSVVADERSAFANNTRRYEQGFVTKVPMIYSNAANEGGSLTTYPVNNTEAGPNQTAANAITLSSTFLCGSANTTILRQRAGLTTYRYQYAGNWTNQDPLPWMGAYHSSDLVMIFGTYTDGEGPCCQPLEVQTNQTMEDHVLAFMRDPYSGPPSVGWYPTNTSAANGGKMLRFGADGKVVQSVSVDAVEAACFGERGYNPFP